uniref:Uncharacterized protein n=1 Tax=Solanum lycopersicum TaxID=4081 RepID=K4CLA5_SOLLC
MVVSNFSYESNCFHFKFVKHFKWNIMLKTVLVVFPRVDRINDYVIHQNEHKEHV